MPLGEWTHVYLQAGDYDLATMPPTRRYDHQLLRTFPSQARPSGGA